MSHPQHPTLKILGVPIFGEDVREGFDPFKDVVRAQTPLGYFGATRMSNGTWSWYLQTSERAADDFDSIGCEVYGDLAACIANADRQLRALRDRSRA